MVAMKGDGSVKTNLPHDGQEWALGGGEGLEWGPMVHLVGEACGVLEDIRAGVNASCGLHIHVGGVDDVGVDHLADWWIEHEEGILEWISSSSRWSREVQAATWEGEDRRRSAARKWTLNIGQARRVHGTVEFRLFFGTVEASSIKAAMRVVARALVLSGAVTAAEISPELAEVPSMPREDLGLQDTAWELLSAWEEEQAEKKSMVYDAIARAAVANVDLVRWYPWTVETLKDLWARDEELELCDLEVIQGLVEGWDISEELDCDDYRFLGAAVEQDLEALEEEAEVAAEAVQERRERAQEARLAAWAYEEGLRWREALAEALDWREMVGAAGLVGAIEGPGKAELEALREAREAQEWGARRDQARREQELKWVARLTAKWEALRAARRHEHRLACIAAEERRAQEEARRMASQAEALKAESDKVLKRLAVVWPAPDGQKNWKRDWSCPPMRAREVALQYVNIRLLRSRIGALRATNDQQVQQAAESLELWQRRRAALTGGGIEHARYMPVGVFFERRI